MVAHPKPMVVGKKRKEKMQLESSSSQRNQEVKQEISGWSQNSRGRHVSRRRGSPSLDPQSIARIHEYQLKPPLSIGGVDVQFHPTKA